MAGPFENRSQLQRVFDALQAASCPWVKDLGLQEDGVLQLLTTPSQHRSNILAWICCSINPNLRRSKEAPLVPEDQEMAMLGRELMLCSAADLELIQGSAGVDRQLSFLEQLLAVVSRTSARPPVDVETLLDVCCSSDNLPHLSQMLEPVCDPWSGLVATSEAATKPSSQQSHEDAADVLQVTQAALEQLQSECEFWNKVPAPCAFSPSSLRVAAGDLQQLIAAFSHVFDSDLRAYCGSGRRGFGADTDVFRRVHQLLQACFTELEMMTEVSEASLSLKEDLEQLQSQGQKHTMQDQLEELSQRTSDFLSLLRSS